MVSPGLQSALIIEVPEAGLAVHRHWERLDANAPLGIPATEQSAGGRWTKAATFTLG